MSLSKLATLAVFLYGACAASAQGASGVRIFRTSAYFVGNCMIKMSNEGPVFTFSANSYSGTRFKSLVPADRKSITVEALNVKGDMERLSVIYEIVDNEVVPLSYVHTNLVTGSIHSCQSLQEERE